MTEEKIPQEEAGIIIQKRRRNRTAVLGAGILLFALTGFCLVVIFFVKTTAGFIKDFVGPDENSAYFEKYLAPVVMFDPDTFRDVSASKTQWQIETAIWAALDENEKNGTYASTPDGREILPVKDVAANFKKYFGVANPKYMTFSHSDFTYEFNKKDQCYYIPLIAVTSYYIPRVKKIDRSFNTVTLTVDYQTGKDWGQDDGNNSSSLATEKTMKIVLKGSRGGYTIKSIQNKN